MGRRRAPPRLQRWPRAFPSPPSPRACPRSNGASPPAIPKNLDTIFGALDRMCQRIAAATDGKFQIRPFAAGEIVPGLQVLDAVQNGTVEAGQTASYYYVGKDPDLRLRLRRPLRPQRPAAERLDVCRRRARAHARLLQGLQHRPIPGGQHRRPDGRLVPQRDQIGRRSEGPEVPHRRHRRQGAGQPRRRAAADRRRRHLPGAGEGHHRRGRMGRPL